MSGRTPQATVRFHTIPRAHKYFHNYIRIDNCLQGYESYNGLEENYNNRRC